MGRFETIWQKLAEHPRKLAVVSGLLAATGFEPLHWWPIAIIALGVFAATVSSAQSWREAAVRGWLFGLVHFTLGLNWIATAFTFQSNMPAFLGWLAVPLLSVYLAIYPGLAAASAKLITGRLNGAPLVLALAGTWIVSEWLRGWVFTGFAWNPIGVMLLGGFDGQGLAILAPYIGTFGLSGIAVLLGASAWLALVTKRMVPLGIVAAVLVVGMLMPAGKGADGTLPFTLVQPNLTQDAINDPTQFDAQFDRIARLSLPAQPGEQRLVLWPESAVPDYLREGYPTRFYERMTWAGDPRLSRLRIARLIGDNSKLLAGVVDLEIEGNRATGAYNAVSAIDDEGAIVAGYNKAHLVPYGEYLPMRWLLEPLGLSRLVAGTLDFIPGPGPRTLDLDEWGNAGIQICYEIIFPGAVVDGDNRPDYIFNPSNDGWFGSWGPPQHLAQARLRAIEEGLPVLRSTTTGISAVIDARGIVREHIGVGEASRLDGIVPPAAEPTWFSRLGNWLSLGWALFLLAGATVAMRRGRG